MKKNIGFKIGITLTFIFLLFVIFISIPSKKNIELKEEESMYEWCKKIDNSNLDEKEEFEFYKFFSDLFEQKIGEEELVSICKNKMGEILIGCEIFVKGIKTGDSSICKNITPEEDKNLCLAFTTKEEEYCKNANMDSWNDQKINIGLEKCKNRLKMISAFEEKNKWKCQEITDTKVAAYCFYHFDKKCQLYDKNTLNPQKTILYEG